jgi:hypothetical protein
MTQPEYNSVEIDRFVFLRRDRDDCIMNRYFFNVTHTLDQLVERWLQEIAENPTDSDAFRQMIHSLDLPAGCRAAIILPSYFNEQYSYISRWRYLNLGEDATCRQVIQKILKFYSHKTIRRCMRGHHRFYGFDGYYPSGYDVVNFLESE